ncbi:MAG TPA: substrate-binding domain-containing protein [Tepidisphaeraceae bacterium]|nr:substrate-binding domain-containing protein [Tepidisphaeraceae bacterium]
MTDNPLHSSQVPSRRRVRVGVIVNNVGGYSRGVVRGIASFAFSRAWVCRVEGINDSRILNNLKDYDGLIVQAATPTQARALSRASIPAVNVSSALPLKQVPSVVSDDRLVGRVAADYLLRRGFRHFAYFSPDNRSFAKLRHEGLSQRLSEVSQSAELARDEPALRAILRRRREPIAIMGCNDRAGLTALDLCSQLGVKVPDEAAILGVDNDEMMQSLAFPGLSTVDTARQRIGFEAAAMLEQLIDRKPPTSNLVFVPPVGVITRQSTDTTAIADGDVAEALRFIERHAGRPIGVTDVTRELPLSRRQLERRFRQIVGRSVLDEIRRCRIERAQQLLVNTELTLKQVAIASGFASTSYLSVVFHKRVGVTPMQYRARSAVSQ